MTSNASTLPPSDAGSCDNPPTPWRKSRAKKLLFEEICNGVTENFSGPSAIWRSNALYKRYKLTNFCNNYRTLKKAIETGRKLLRKIKVHTTMIFPLSFNDGIKSSSGKVRRPRNNFGKTF